MMWMVLSMLSMLAFADDPYTCAAADPQVPYTLVTATHGGYPDGDLYDHVVGAGGGSVTWNGAALTIPVVAGIMSQGPSGHTLNLFGHFEDPSNEPIDHYLWLWTEKTDGRKYLWVLTDRTITGDTAPRKYGEVQVVWTAAYSRPPVSGDSWPPLTDIAESVQKDVSAYLAVFESAYQTGGAGGLATAAKANCAQTYGASVCNGKTWTGSDRRFLIFPNDEVDGFVASFDGNAYLHDPADVDDSSSSAMISAWVLVWLGGCQTSNCPPVNQDDCPEMCAARGMNGFNGCMWIDSMNSEENSCDQLNCWRRACGVVVSPDTYSW